MVECERCCKTGTIHDELLGIDGTCELCDGLGYEFTDEPDDLKRTITSFAKVIDFPRLPITFEKLVGLKVVDFFSILAANKIEFKSF